MKLNSAQSAANVRPLRRKPDKRRAAASDDARAQRTSSPRTPSRRPADRGDLLDPERLAEHLGVSARFVRRLVEERRVPYLKVGKFVRFDLAEVDDWLEQQRVKASRA